MKRKTTRTHLAAIDGTDSRLAPRPPRKSWMQCVYDVVEANTGWSSIKSIRELLPAVLDSKQMIPREKLHGALYNAVYAGYLIEHDGTYRIAPLAYYESRQKVLQEQRDRQAQKDATLPTRKALPKFEVRPLWHRWVLGGIACVAFVNGMAFGLLLGVLL